MKVAIGADHARFKLKQCIKAHLRKLKHETIGVGTNDSRPLDYPDFVKAFERRFSSKAALR